MHKYRIVNDLDVNTQAGQELAHLGRNEIEMAEREMPGLMALRAEFVSTQPLKGAHCRLPSHDCTSSCLD